MFRSRFFPDEGTAGRFNPGSEPLRQGRYHHQEDPAARTEEGSGPGNKVLQYRKPRLGGDVGEDEIPPGFRRPRKEGFRVGLQNCRGNMVFEGVVLGKTPGQFVPVLGTDP
jgi:hypothetical protein